MTSNPNQAFFDHEIIVMLNRYLDDIGGFRGAGLYADIAGVTLLVHETYVTDYGWSSVRNTDPTFVPWSSIAFVRSPQFSGAINRVLEESFDIESFT